MNAQNLSIQGLYPKDELTLYLVLNGLKPATLIDFDPLYINAKAQIERNDAQGIVTINTNEDINLTNQEIQEFRTHLLSLNLLYNKKCDSSYHHGNIFHSDSTIYTESYFVAKDKPALEHLVNSWNNIDHNERGLALGYPKLASKYFKNYFDGNYINAEYLITNITKAAKANANIPLWLGYISHIPVKIDILKDIYSKESEEQGKLFESFVRETNPLLAEKVDTKFRLEIDFCKKI